MEKCRGGCGLEKSLDQFGIKPDGSYYKHCIECREKKDITKRRKSIGDNNYDEKKVKRENRPNISDEKKQMVLCVKAKIMVPE